MNESGFDPLNLLKLRKEDEGGGEKEKVYDVEIEAENNGKVVKFTETVSYGNTTRAVEEGDREAKAVAQAKERMPHLKNVRALSSVGRYR